MSTLGGAASYFSSQGGDADYQSGQGGTASYAGSQGGAAGYSSGPTDYPNQQDCIQIIIIFIKLNS